MAGKITLKIVQLNTKKLEGAIKQSLEKAREEIFNEVLPRLKRKLDAIVQAKYLPVITTLKNADMKGIFSLGAFGIPRDGGPQIDPANFDFLFFDDQGLSSIRKESTGARLRWFDLEKAYQKTEYEWTPHGTVSWLRILEEGEKGNPAFLYVGGDFNSPDPSRSGFGVMAELNRARRLIERKSAKGQEVNPTPLPFVVAPLGAFKIDPNIVTTFLNNEVARLLKKRLAKFAKGKFV
jgi:hypothetical protein